MEINKEAAAHMMYDNLETLVHELSVANIIVEEQIKNRDVQKDFFTSMEIIQLIVESLQWIAYIDKLQASTDIQNDSGLNEYLQKMTELQQYIILTTNIIKEHI